VVAGPTRAFPNPLSQRRRQEWFDDFNRRSQEQFEIGFVVGSGLAQKLR